MLVTAHRKRAANVFLISDLLSSPRRVRDAKRHRGEQRLYNGGKRRFGWDVFDGRLVPNATERAVFERMKVMRANGVTYRDIGGEVGMHGRTVQRILDRT